ncbi:hypothetical protein [Leisingera caerulea]|uniref:hypothetical protein n=1 Tax=Leisingera caerulea TaxID=506591 RepID=UPI000480DF4A|nr:hypothetical protein [Leisingera caerulea]
MMAPLPRLELRWREATDDERERMDFATHACDYGLSLPVDKTDVRSNIWHEDKNEEIGVLTEIFYPFSTTLTSHPGEPGRGPIRDACHATWDAKKLGGLPVFVRTIDGELSPLTN